MIILHLIAGVIFLYLGFEAYWWIRDTYVTLRIRFILWRIKFKYKGKKLRAEDQALIDELEKLLKQVT